MDNLEDKTWRAQHTSIRATLMRGGTSKGVFVRENDLPPPGPARDAFILELMGSPDPMQLDGLGGTYSSTSKLMAISSSGQPGIDVDYLFAQVGIDQPIVDYEGNCGNLTAAVAAYAIDEGFVTAVEPITRVHLFNKNTGVHVLADVATADGRAASIGNARVAGVPTPGAPIVSTFLDPAGAVFRKLYPTGKPVDRLETPMGPIDVSIVDVAHPVAFLRASDLGIHGNEPPAVLNSDAGFVARLEAIRGACAVHLGVVRRAGDAALQSPVVPRLVIVSPPRDPSANVTVIGVSLGKVHHAVPLTSAMCTAAAVALEHTIPNEVGRKATGDVVMVAHAKGTIEVAIDVEPGDPPRVRSISLRSSARRLMDGTAYVRGNYPASADSSTRRPAAVSA